LLESWTPGTVRQGWESRKDRMDRFRQPPGYIYAFGFILGGLVAGLVFGLGGIGGIVVGGSLSLLFMLALRAILSRISRE
jgi:hypothetical protein